MTTTTDGDDTSPYTGFWRPHGQAGCALFGHDWSRWFIDGDRARRMCRQCYQWQYGDGELRGPKS